MLGCDIALSRFNFLILKLLDRTTLHTHNMIVMAGTFDLKDRMTFFKKVSLNEINGFELGQYAVYRRKTDLLAVL